MDFIASLMGKYELHFNFRNQSVFRRVCSPKVRASHRLVTACFATLFDEIWKANELPSKTAVSFVLHLNGPLCESMHKCVLNQSFITHSK